MSLPFYLVNHNLLYPKLDWILQLLRADEMGMLNSQEQFMEVPKVDTGLSTLPIPVVVPPYFFTLRRQLFG